MFWKSCSHDILLTRSLTTNTNDVMQLYRLHWIHCCTHILLFVGQNVTSMPGRGRGPHQSNDDGAFAHLDAAAFLSKQLTSPQSATLNQSEACEQRFGSRFASDQQQHKFLLCHAPPLTAGHKAVEQSVKDQRSTSPSSVGCFNQPAAGNQYKDALTFCVAHNMLFDTCRFFAGVNKGFDVRLPAPKLGAVTLGCLLNQTALQSKVLMRGQKNTIWWKDAAQDQQYEAVHRGCDSTQEGSNVVEHPVVFIIRDRYTHPMHELEIFATIFTALVVSKLPEVARLGLQVVIADHMPQAGYRHTYAAISHPYKIRHLVKEPYPNGTCFRTAMIIHAFSNALPFNTRPELANCTSTLLLAVHRWIHYLHKELDPGLHVKRPHKYAETSGVTRRNVLWMSRRTIEAMRSKSGALSHWQALRVVPNDLELVQAMQAAIHTWNTKSCILQQNLSSNSQTKTPRPGVGEADACRNSAVMFDFVFGEFSDVPYYPDQLITLFRTGVIVGVHGAGLTFIFHMPPGASAVIELVPEGLEDKQPGNVLVTIPSITHNMGSFYRRLHYKAPYVDPADLAEALTRSMDQVNAAILDQSPAASDTVSFTDQFTFAVQRADACLHNSESNFTSGEASSTTRTHFKQHPLKKRQITPAP